jgi:hypothetical protein
MGTAYVSAYEARPMLHVRPERNRRLTELSFVEAVGQDTQPTVEELLPAYRVAGDAFPGRLRELFIVLDDDVSKNKPAKSGSQKKKNKRSASGDGPAERKKTVPSTQ